MVKLPELRWMRKDRGFSRQEDLAKASGVGISTISHAEQGGRTQRKTAEKIAAALGVTVEELEGR